VLFKFSVCVSSLIFVSVKMRNKPKSAAALLSFLLFFFLSSTGTKDLSAEIQKSRIQESQGMLVLKRLKRGGTNAQDSQVVLGVDLECVAAVSCSQLSVLSTLSGAV